MGSGSAGALDPPGVGELFEQAPDPLFAVDRQGRVKRANQRALSWLGASEDDLLGQPLPEVLHLDDAGAFDRLAGSGWRGLAERRFTTGDRRKVSLKAAPLPDTRPPRWLFSVRDVTTLNALDEAAGHVERMESLAGLAGAVAREMNDPMSIVQGRLELLLELGGFSPEDLERHLRVALVHARRISATLQNMRLVGRGSVANLRRVFLRDIVEGMKDLIGPRLEAVELRVEFEPDELSVGGVQALYARVFAILVDRLIDFCGRDGRLEVRARVEPHEGVTVHLLGGAGVPPGASLAAPPAGDEAHLDDGGLGLSLAGTLVESMGGELVARSTGGRGLFELHLPRSPRVRVRKRAIDRHLLVVGSRGFLASLEELLGREGFALQHAPTAEAALELLAGGSDVDGAVVRLLLPGMSGMWLVRELDRRHPRLRGQVLLVSKPAVCCDVDQVEVLRVPLERDTLLRALGRRVRRRR